MQASKKIPFDNPTVLFLVRALYIVSNLVIGGLYFYTQQQINKKRGRYSRIGTAGPVTAESKTQHADHHCAQI